MEKMLKSTFVFSILFFAILTIDLFLKINDFLFPRLISKALLIGLLLFYYCENKKYTTSNFKNRVTYIALTICLLADLILVYSHYTLLYIIGISIMLVAKCFYAYRFSTFQDFNVLKLLPFFLSCFVYMTVVIFLIYDKLGDFIIPGTIYIFTCLVMALFAYMRLGVENTLSFSLVFVDVLSSICSDTFVVLGAFYFGESNYTKIGVMLFYALSQFLIIIGLTKETFQLEKA